MKLESCGPYKQNLIILDRLRCVERCRALKRFFLAVEVLSRIYREVSIVKESRWIKIAIEELSSNQKVSRWIEVAIERYQECDKKLLKSLDRQLSYKRCPQLKDFNGSRQLSSIQKVSRWIKQLSRSYRECDKKQMKGLDRQPSYQEVSSSYRDCLKTVFQEEKNIYINAIKHATQPNIQTAF